MKKINIYYNRLIDYHLAEWKNSEDRKPLLLRGARQTGKSSAIRNIAPQFKHYIEINFEEQAEIHTLFQGNKSPVEICEKLAVLFKTPIEPDATLLFFDEIQACIPALSSLRFFYEKMPELHVVAAGSLLEFALEELPSYGVGRIRSLYVYPFSFDEFLMAINEGKLVELKKKASKTKPLDDVFHRKLTGYLKTFLITGGMPEVVSKYAQKSNLLDIQNVLDDLIGSIRSDFAKYKKKVPTLRISEVFDSVTRQMGGKFVFSKAVSDTNLKQIREAVELLIMAGLVLPVIHSSANGIPLGAEINPKKQKFLLLDTGVFQRIIGLNLADILLEDDFNSINKGAIAELFSGLELIKYQNPYQWKSLYYWHRETVSSNAEVDYVVQLKNSILPIEVKSSGTGSMQSMYQFIREKKSKRGIRFSMENFSSVNEIDIFPLYAISTFVQEIFHHPPNATSLN